MFNKVVYLVSARTTYTVWEECFDSGQVGSNESLLGVPLGRHLCEAGVVKVVPGINIICYNAI